MMTNYAAEYTRFNVRDMAQLLIGSGWNTRDLNFAVGNGTKVTLFAALDTAFDSFTSDDTTRLSTDKWIRHLWDFLKHSMIQGEWTMQDLKQLVLDNDGQPVQLTMLTGENTTLAYDATRNMVTLEGGDVFFGDVKAVDGLLHFTKQVPKPHSITHTTYTLAKQDPRFKIHTDYIDAVFLTDDINTLLPLTVLYVPNDILDGKKLRITDASDTLLENHVFKELLWCEKLEEHAREQSRIASHNGRTWRVTMHPETNRPCLDTVSEEGGQVFQACITECDILARNGIMHVLDDVLIYQTLEEIPAAPPVPVIPVAPKQPVNAVGGSGGDGGGSAPVGAPVSAFEESMREQETTRSNAAWMVGSTLMRLIALLF